MPQTVPPIRVRSLSVGPIVGATAPDSVRLFGRSNFSLDPIEGQESDRVKGIPRVFGTARVWPADSEPGGREQVFMMSPNFDFTAVTVFSDLQPNTRYAYQMGWFSGRGRPTDYEGMGFDWSKPKILSFSTGTVDPTAERTFVFGSCRYLLKLLPHLLLFDDRGDKTFRSILAQHEERPLDSLFLLGDQIYADDLDSFKADELLHEYNERYRQAFSQRHLRHLMGQVSTYMTLDDHEIEDGWPARSSHRDWLRKYPAAMHSFMTYQASHSPLFDIHPRQPHRITGEPNHLWYQFQDGCCDFFVTDTRTERYLADDQKQREIISGHQLDALIDWLRDGSERIKFLVSSVPFFPDYRRKPKGRSSGDDKWTGFPAQRDRVLNTICEHRPRGVVALSGDSHLSTAATLTHPDHPEFRVHSIVSSPFFWPYPHPRLDKFQDPGPIHTLPKNAGYEVSEVAYIHPTDNFTRITASLDRLEVEVYARKGRQLSKIALEL